MNSLHLPLANGKYVYTSLVELPQSRRIIEFKIFCDHRNEDNSFNDLQQQVKKIHKWKFLA